MNLNHDYTARPGKLSELGIPPPLLCDPRCSDKGISIFALNQSSGPVMQRLSPNNKQFLYTVEKRWVRVVMQKQTISKRPRLLTCQQHLHFAPNRYSLQTSKRTSSGSCSLMQYNKDKLTLQISQQSTTAAVPQVITRSMVTLG